MVDGRGGEGSGGEARSMEDDIRHWRQRGAITHRLKAPVWPEEGSKEGGGQSTGEYGGTTVPKRGAVIKDNNGRLITESKEVLRIWAANFKELLNGNGAASCVELPSTGTGGYRAGRSGNSNAQDEKGKATWADEVRLEMLEMAGEVGVKWTGRLLNVCMQEGRVPKKWRMGLIVPIWMRKGDVMTKTVQGHHTSY